MPSFRAQSRNPPCTLFFLAPFAEGFQFYFVTHTTLYRCARKIEDFARDDVAEVAFSQHILYTGRGLSIPPYRHFERSREIFLALCSFLLPSQKVSPFPLSHIRRYTGVPERSLGFARDDVAEAAFSQHILYTGRGLSIPPYRHFERSREIFLALCSFLLLSQKGSNFTLSHIRRYTGVQERSRTSLGMTLRKWHFPNISFIRDVGYPSPHTVISSAVEKSSLHSALSCFLRKRFPLFRCLTYGAIPVCQKDPSASLGMTLREYRSLTLPIYFPCNNDTREAPSTFAALLFFMRRTTPLNPTT